MLTLDTPRLEHLSLINTTQQLILRHTDRLHTLKIIAKDTHELDFNALTHLTELKLVVPLARPQARFPYLRKLSVTLALLADWSASAPNLNEVGLYYDQNPHLQNASLTALLPNVHTLDIHHEDTILALPYMSAPTFKCTKFDFQNVSCYNYSTTSMASSNNVQDTVVDKLPSNMENFWIRSSNIVALPQAWSDKDGSLLLPALKSLHIFKTSTMCRVFLKQVPYISLIANYGSDIVINVTNVHHLELIDNSCKITLQGDFSLLRHLIIRRNTSIKISDERETLNKRALLTFDSDIV